MLTRTALGADVGSRCFRPPARSKGRVRAKRVNDAPRQNGSSRQLNRSDEVRIAAGLADSKAPECEPLGCIAASHGGHRRSTSGCSTRLPLALLAVHSLLDDPVARTDLLELDLGSTGRSADRSNAINHFCQSPWCLDTLQPPPGPSSIPAGPAPRPGQPLDFWSRRHRPGLRHPTALALSLAQPPQATTTKRRQIRQKPCAGPTVSRAQPRSRRGRLQRPPGRIYLRPIRKLTGRRARGHDAARSASAARVQQRHRPPPLPRPGASGGGGGLSTGRRRTQAARRPRA